LHDHRLRNLANLHLTNDPGLVQRNRKKGQRNSKLARREVLPTQVTASTGGSTRTLGDFQTTGVVSMDQESEQGFVKITENFRERTSPVWDMSQERALNDTLLGQRFNFFIVFFSLVIAGAINAKTQQQLEFVLAIGFVICLLLALVVARTHKKLNIILTILSADPTHPFTIVDRKASAGSKQWINDMGLWIPTLCCAMLFLGFLLSVSGILTAPQPKP
jgi:hypothetical protein